jgi:ankyrin repeat protein
MADETGASPRELLIEAARRNNTSLLNSLLASPQFKKDPSATASFLNTTTDALGASALHIAAQHGSYDVLDIILDQEGVEIDHPEKREGDTCLHKAVRYCNELSVGDAGGKAVVEILLDAGCDPRIRNKAKLRAVDLLDPRNTDVRGALQRAEVAMTAGGDVVDEDEDDDGRDGPGSESD